MTTILIVVNVVVFALQLIAGLPGMVPLARVFGFLALLPSDLAHGYVWQLLTFQFLHGGFMHLFINCLVLYFFGFAVETMLGKSTFLKLYLATGAAGGLLQAFCSWVFPTHFGTGPVVGASAGVFGVVAAFAYLNRETSITAWLAFILPVTMKAKYLLIVLLVIAVLGILERGTGVAHAAHLGGMLAALGYLQLERSGRLSSRRWPRFKVVRPRREFVATARPIRKRWAGSGRNRTDELPPAEFISREVDPILEKISAHGIQSLTERERRILELAKEKMSRG